MATALKFRGMKLGAEGRSCAYRFINSDFSSPEKLFLENDVHIGPGALIDAAGEVHIGEGTIFAPNVQIYSRTHNFDVNLQALPFDNVMLTSPVRVGRYVWVGSRAIILPGVSIGDGAVIGAGAVVAKNVPSCAIVVGNPARIVRYRNRERFEEIVREDVPFVYRKFGHAKKFRTRDGVIAAVKEIG